MSIQVKQIDEKSIKTRLKATVEKNIENKAELENDLWELIGENWDRVKAVKGN